MEIKGRLSFAGSSVRPRKIDTSSNEPIIKLLGVTEEQKSYKFEITEAVRSMLEKTGDTPNISILRDVLKDEIFTESGKSVRLNKNNTFTSKSSYLDIKNKLNINIEDTVIFYPSIVEVDGYILVQLSQTAQITPIQEIETIIDTTNEELQELETELTTVFN